MIGAFDRLHLIVHFPEFGMREFMDGACFFVVIEDQTNRLLRFSSGPAVFSPVVTSRRFEEVEHGSHDLRNFHRSSAKAIKQHRFIDDPVAHGEIFN